MCLQVTRHIGRGVSEHWILLDSIEDTCKCFGSKIHAYISEALIYAVEIGVGFDDVGRMNYLKAYSNLFYHGMQGSGPLQPIQSLYHCLIDYSSCPHGRIHVLPHNLTMCGILWVADKLCRPID